MKDNPHHLLEKAGIKKQQLPEEAEKVLSMHDQALAMKEKYPENENLQQSADKIIAKANEATRKLISAYLEKTRSKEEKLDEKKLKKELSKQVMEEIKTIDMVELDACRRKINAFNKNKRQKEGKKNVKKTRRTKLKERALTIIRLTPPDLVKDLSIQKENRRIINRLISELMKNWQMNQINPTRKALNKELDKIEEKANPPKAKVS